MKTPKRDYMVDTGNNTSWYATLDSAILDYNKWVDFYDNTENIKNYGEREITLSIKGEVVYSTHIFLDN